MDPDDDLAAATTARGVQVLTAVSMMTENLVRARQYRAYQQADRDYALARGRRAEHLAEQGAARAAYGVTADPGWARRATVVDAARAWAGAQEWAGRDPSAAVAQRRAEAVLRRHSPAAMARYDVLRGQGVDELAAMRQAAPLFIAVPLTTAGLTAAGAARADAGAEQSRADGLRATPDAQATAADEATLASHAAARHQGSADHAAAQATAPVVAGQAYRRSAASGPPARGAVVAESASTARRVRMSPEQRWEHVARRPR